MPQGPMSSPLMKPFVVLALPGMYLFYKYNQYKRKRRESAKRRLTERELQHLNSKIVSSIWSYYIINFLHVKNHHTY